MSDPNDELSVEELEDVAGGGLDENGNCGAVCNANCVVSCGVKPPSEEIAT